MQDQLFSIDNFIFIYKYHQMSGQVTVALGIDLYFCVFSKAPCYWSNSPTRGCTFLRESSNGLTVRRTNKLPVLYFGFAHWNVRYILPKTLSKGITLKEPKLSYCTSFLSQHVNCSKRQCSHFDVKAIWLWFFEHPDVIYS